MSTLECFLLSIVQGITEFLPISSTAHLKVILKILHLENEDINFLIELINLGTIFSIIVFYFSDIKKIFCGFFSFFFRNNNTADNSNFKFFISMLIGSVPAISLLGFFSVCFKNIHDFFEYGWLCGIFSAFALIFFDLLKSSNKKFQNSYKEIFLIGIAQVFAVIPFVSRLGSCLILSRFFEYTRSDALKISLLLSIPVMAANLIFTVWSHFAEIYNFVFAMSFLKLFILFFATFVIGIFTLFLLNKFLKKHTFLGIAVYKILFIFCYYIFFIKHF